MLRGLDECVSLSHTTAIDKITDFPYDVEGMSWCELYRTSFLSSWHCDSKNMHVTIGLKSLILHQLIGDFKKLKV